MKINRKLKKGFTLVELIVVIAIVAILAAVSVVSYLAFIRQANESADVQLVKQLNTSLQGDETLNGKRATMYDMLGAMEENGFVVENLTKTKSGYDIVWDQTNNRFALLDNNEKLVYGEESYSKAKTYNVWKFADTFAEAKNSKYSVYLTKDFKTEETTLEISAGLDVGDFVGLSQINYTHTGDAQTVVIRSNSGSVNVNATSDTVKHYGEAQAVTLTAVGTNSYYENGAVDQVNIKKGRLVLTNNEETSVGTIYLQATGENYDNIIIATQSGAQLPDMIVRDNVPLPTGTDSKTVVTIQSNVDAEGKNPEKTETINLYATAGTTGNDVYEATNGYNVSDLALLVVEASSTEAKEKAAEQISDPEVLASVTESKSSVEVYSEETLTNALAAKAKYIIVTDSFDTEKAFLIKSSTIIEGAKLSDGTYPNIISKATTKSEKRGFRISESDISVVLRNLTVDVRTNVKSDNGYPRGLQIDSIITGVKLIVDNCDISATHYAFNVCDGANVEAIFTNSHLLGYGALNLWHADYNVKVFNCVLEGIQNNKERFGVVVLEGDTTGKTDLHSTSVTVQIDNSELIATCNSASGTEAFIGFNSKSVANTVALNNSVLTSKGEGKTITVYDSGTSNKLYIDNELFDVVAYENKLFDENVEANRSTVADSIDNAVLYYWIGANGAKAGGYYSIETIFENGYVMDGEYVSLMENIVLSNNLSGSSGLKANDKFTFTTNGFTVTGGTITLGANITAVSDSSSLSCFVNFDGTVITPANNGNGTYSYTGN